MKSENYVITPPNLFSGFALGSNSFYVIAFARNQNYEILSCIALFVDYGLTSRKCYLFDKKLQNSCVSEHTLMFLTCQIKSAVHNDKVLRKRCLRYSKAL